MKEDYAIMKKWGLACATIGKLTETGRMVLTTGDAIVCDIPVAPLSDPAGSHLQTQPDNVMAELIHGATNSPTDQPKSIFDSFKVETAPASSPGQPR